MSVEVKQSKLVIYEYVETTRERDERDNERFTVRVTAAQRSSAGELEGVSYTCNRVLSTPLHGSYGTEDFREMERGQARDEVFAQLRAMVMEHRVVRTEKP
jgi:hypothetical protein